jgi:predicted permease
VSALRGHRPPARLERLIEGALPAGLSAQGTLGDLAEEFECRANMSPWSARLWYARQAASILLYRRVARGDSGVQEQGQGTARAHGSGAADGRGSGAAGTRGSGAANGLGSGPSRPPGFAAGVSRLELRTDLRWALRGLLRHPGFSLAVIAVLGLGLGANVAVYAVLDGTLANTSWWADPGATVAISPGTEFSFGQLDMYQDEQAVYRALGGYVERAWALQTPDGESVSVNGAAMTPALFRELAAQPQLGRALADDDAAVGSERVVVIGDGLWRRHFGADPAVIGSRITVSGAPATVVGIQGAGGNAPGGRAELWFPLIMDPRDDDFWKERAYTLVGVLKPGVAIDDAFTDIRAFGELLSQIFPGFFGPDYALEIGHVAAADEAQRRLVATPLILLFAGTALLMGVTALNVGNLLLGRAIDRRRELAVRVSLGAARARIVRLLLVEGLVLTVPALALGLATGALGAGAIARMFVEQAVVATSSVASPPVLAFAAALAAAAWVIVNVVPAAHFLRTQRGSLSLRPDSAAGVQRALVAVQAALATLLLVSATLLVATVDNLRRVPLGFDSDGLVTVELSTPADRVAAVPVARELYDRLAGEVAALPGVEAAGLTGWLPLRAQAPTVPINPEAAPVDPREAVKAPLHLVDAGFFEVFGIEPLEGRLLGIDERDPETYLRADGMVPGPSAVLINASLAALLFPDGGAVGQRIAIDPHAWMTWVPVVGVIPDIRSGEITGPAGPALYVSLAESPSRDVTLVVRAQGATAPLVPAIRSTVRRVDPLVPIRSIAAMDDVVRAAYSTAWVMMGLLIVLAVLATGLGAIGIYAVLAQHVALNRREIGVRLALGARPGAVVSGVVRSGLVLAGAGIAIGSAAAVVSTRYLESLLFGVSALAPWAFAAPALALAVAAALAAWIPAARAGRLPPSEVLRSE